MQKKKRTKTKVSTQIIKNAEKISTKDKINTYILNPYDFFLRRLSGNTKWKPDTCWLINSDA